MTKQEVRAILEPKGGARDHSSSEWNEAFRLYNEANKYAQLRRGSCGSCYRKVWEWLTK